MATMSDRSSLILAHTRNRANATELNWTRAAYLQTKVKPQPTRDCVKQLGVTMKNNRYLQPNSKRMSSIQKIILVVCIYLCPFPAIAQQSALVEAARSTLVDQYKWWACYGKFSNDDLNNQPEGIKISAGVTTDFFWILGKDPWDVIKTELPLDEKKITGELHEISYSFGKGSENEVRIRCDQFAFELGFDAFGGRDVQRGSIPQFRRLAENEALILAIWKNCKAKLQYSYEFKTLLNTSGVKTWWRYRYNLAKHGRSNLRQYGFDSIKLDTSINMKVEERFKTLSSSELGNFCTNIF